MKFFIKLQVNSFFNKVFDKLSSFGRIIVDKFILKKANFPLKLSKITGFRLFLDEYFNTFTSDPHIIAYFQMMRKFSLKRIKLAIFRGKRQNSIKIFRNLEASMFFRQIFKNKFAIFVVTASEPQHTHISQFFGYFREKL